MLRDDCSEEQLMDQACAEHGCGNYAINCGNYAINYRRSRFCHECSGEKDVKLSVILRKRKLAIEKKWREEDL